jgi:hypothetical protein
MSKVLQFVGFLGSVLAVTLLGSPAFAEESFDSHLGGVHTWAEVNGRVDEIVGLDEMTPLSIDWFMELSSLKGRIGNPVLTETSRIGEAYCVKGVDEEQPNGRDSYFSVCAFIYEGVFMFSMTVVESQGELTKEGKETTEYLLQNSYKVPEDPDIVLDPIEVK